MSENQSGYIFVCADEESKHDGVELPTEDNGNLLLSVLQSQYENASGLRYRNPSTGGWRAVKLVDGMLLPPTKDGWSDTTYVVVVSSGKPEANGNESTDTQQLSYNISNTPSVGYSSSSDGYKRKLEDSEGERATKTARSSSPEYFISKSEHVDVEGSPPPPPPPTASSKSQDQTPNLQDLIVLGLEYGVKDEELRNYFETYGEVTHAEVKKDFMTGRSRGFGFVRFSSSEIQKKVYGMKHSIKGRRIELKFPRQSPAYMPTKLFVGCLPLKPEVTKEEMTEYFAEFGKIDDIYIPRPYRGFGFVTFNEPQVAQKVLSMTHTLRKSTLNITTADPKGAVRPSYPSPHFQSHYANPGSYDPYTQQQHSYGYGSYQQAPQQHATSAASGAHYSPYSGAPAPASNYGYGYSVPQSGGNYTGAMGSGQADKGQGFVQRSYAPNATHPQVQPQQQQPQASFQYSQPPTAYNTANQQTQQRLTAADKGMLGYSGGLGRLDQRGGGYMTRDYQQQPQQQQPQQHHYQQQAQQQPAAGGGQQHYDPKSAWQNY